MSHFITNAPPTGILGTIAHYPKGFRFITATSGHASGRVHHETPEAAIPRWINAGYLVKANDGRGALQAVEAFREGQHWADQLGIKVIRTGGKT